MTGKKQEKLCDTSKTVNGWGTVVREFYNEDGKRVCIYENGCSTIGEPNHAAKKEVASNIIRFLVENPSILEIEDLSPGNSIQICFRD